MLADDMVPDEKQRRSYLETLRNESDRLTHLVENVLSFARLERGRKNQLVPTKVDHLLERMRHRLTERAHQAKMQLQLDVKSGDESIKTNESVVEQIVFNLVDNACKYAGAAEDNRIVIKSEKKDGEIEICVRDYGPGIPNGRSRKRFQPFSKTVEEAAITAPGIGLGLALCRRLAKDLGGSLTVQSSADSKAGTNCCLRLPLA